MLATGDLEYGKKLEEMRYMIFSETELRQTGRKVFHHQGDRCR
jgi:hypothetical protein